MSKHTKGKWEIMGTLIPKDAQEPMHAVGSPRGDVGYAFTEADARLFAAAPDLLTELKNAVAMLNTVGLPRDAMPQDFQKMKDAIAIAEGKEKKS